MISIKVYEDGNRTTAETSVDGIGDDLISEIAVGVYAIATDMGKQAEKENFEDKENLELDIYSAVVAFYIANRTGTNLHTDEGQNFVKGMEFAAKQFIDMNINLNSLVLDEYEEFEEAE